MQAITRRAKGEWKLLLRQVLAQVKRNSDDDNQALCNVGVGRLDAQELQDDLQNFEHQNADQDAGDLTNAAVNGNTADGTAGDGLKLPTHTGIDGAAAGLGADQEAGQDRGILLG